MNSGDRQEFNEIWGNLFRRFNPKHLKLDDELDEIFDMLTEYQAQQKISISMEDLHQVCRRILRNYRFYPVPAELFDEVDGLMYEKEQARQRELYQKLSEFETNKIRNYVEEFNRLPEDEQQKLKDRARALTDQIKTQTGFNG